MTTRCSPASARSSRKPSASSSSRPSSHAYGTARQPDAEKALAAAEKIAKALANQLTKKVRDGGLLDREFDQFGQNALKTVLKEVSAKVREWVAAVAIPDKKPKTAPAEPDVDQAAETLARCSPSSPSSMATMFGDVASNHFQGLES